MRESVACEVASKYIVLLIFLAPWLCTFAPCKLQCGTVEDPFDLTYLSMSSLLLNFVDFLSSLHEPSSSAAPISTAQPRLARARAYMTCSGLPGSLELGWFAGLQPHVQARSGAPAA